MKLYLDTSVLSAYFDQRNAERAAMTQEFWHVLGSHEVFISDLTTMEIEKTQDEKLRSSMLSLVKELPRAAVWEHEEARKLAAAYVNAGAMPQKYLLDAMHIAAAILEGADALVSWNFRHIVRMRTRRVVQYVNSLRALPQVEIVTPADFLE